MDMTTLAKGIVIVGLALVVLGGLIWLLGRLGLPVGQLPGDIHIKGENVSCYVPIATMILVSLVLTVVLNVVIRLLNR